jgi:hypothetical protein
LCTVVSDRFAAIHDAITEWQKQDPGLIDKSGFLEYLKARDIGVFNVGDTKRWMEYLQEAMKEKITVAELLFESRKKMLLMDLIYKKGPKEDEQRIFELDEEKRREMDEMSERLKTYDPARAKRREHESR